MGRPIGAALLSPLTLLVFARFGACLQPSVCPHCRVPAMQRPPRCTLISSQAKETMQVGSQIVAANDWNSSSPEYGIVRAQSYELRRVYYQGLVNGEVTRVDVQNLEAAQPAGCEGFTKYVMLYSPRYHSDTGPVIVRPDEVLVVSLQSEILDSTWLALPGLVWVLLAFSFYQYGEANGGTFAVFSKASSAGAGYF